MRRVALSFALLGCLACDDVEDSQPPPLDMGPTVDQGPAPTCVEDPTTHLEIINACTTATGITKAAVTPLRRADGTLPPLP